MNIHTLFCDLPKGIHIAIVPYQREHIHPIPLFASTVPAGFPSPAEDYLDASLDLNDLVIKHPAATFFVRAKGHSMIDALPAARIHPLTQESHWPFTFLWSHGQRRQSLARSSGHAHRLCGTCPAPARISCRSYAHHHRNQPLCQTLLRQNHPGSVRNPHCIHVRYDPLRSRRPQTHLQIRRIL